MSDVRISREGHVALVEICRGPDNFFDADLLCDLATVFEECDRDYQVRSLVFCTEGKNFCAGAQFADQNSQGFESLGARLYPQAVRLFRCETPVVAAVQGAAIGGGLGLSLVADFRVASSESRFSANFNRLGMHPGFGLTVTLPRVVGVQQAAALFYTGRRISGNEAHNIGLVDLLVPRAELRAAALKLANEIAESAPLAVIATRRTLRSGLADQIAQAVERELSEQAMHLKTEDFREGVKAMTERRAPLFIGR